MTTDPYQGSSRLAERSPLITIGVLCESVANGYWEPILSELAVASGEHGVRLITFIDWMSPEELAIPGRRFVTDLAGPLSVDAVLLLSIGYRMSAQDLAAYCERFRPLPTCGLVDVDAPWCSGVQVDNERGMRDGVMHLVETHGYRSVAFVRGPEASAEAEVRYRIYREVLEKNGISLDPELVAPGDFTIHGGAEAVRLLIDERGVMPRAIVSANDGMALGALEALTARGIRVPQEVALLGFDNVDLTAYSDPPLTTVRQPLRELGRAALELLVQQLEPGSAPARRVLPSRLVIRESCGCLAYGGESARLQHSLRPPAKATTPLEAFASSLNDLVNAIHALGITGAPSPAWLETLCEVFASDLSSTGTTFLSELRRVLLVAINAHGDIGGFQKMVTLVWQHVRSFLQADTREWMHADDLLHRARLVISNIAGGLQTSRMLRFEDFTNKLTPTFNAIALAVNLQELASVLRRHLPLYGITAAYICVYEESGLASRLVAGFSADQELELPRGQSVVSGLSRKIPNATPREILPVVNTVLFENVRDRMAQDEYVTMTLLRYTTNGRLTFAGAHEDILVCRAVDGGIEWIATPGTWIAAARQIDAVTVDTSFELGEGDLLLLYTDGVTEARAANGEVFGPDRLAENLQRLRLEPVEKIRDGLLAALIEWTAHQEDDVTFLVARHHGKKAQPGD